MWLSVGAFACSLITTAVLVAVRPVAKPEDISM
jgi:hypothetical protein